MMKRLLWLFVVLVFVCSVISGCNGSDSEYNADNSDVEDVTIKYMTFSASPNHIEDLENMIKLFNEKYPNITVEYEAVGWDNYFTKLQTLIAGNNAPDTFELNYENFVTYASKGVLKDLSKLMKGDKSFDKKVFDQNALEAYKYDGTQYGLVESFSNVVMFYNKDLFDKAGVGYPNKTWTWKKELDAADKLTNTDEGIWGTYSPIQFWEFYKTIEQNNGKIFDKKGNVVINSKENVETLQWMIDKIEKYKVTPSDAQMSGQSDGDLFKAGKIGMLRTGIWMFDSFKDAPFEWDIELEPGNKRKAHHFFANGVAISKDCDKAKAAWKWISFFTSSKEAATIRVDSSWELPALSDRNLVNRYLEKTPPESREVVFDALNTLVVPPVIGNWNEFTDIVGKELEKAKLGEKTPQEALDDAKVAIEKLIE